MPNEKLLKALFAKLFIALIVIVIVMNIYSDTVPIIQESGNQINETQAPLALLFAGDGVIMTIIMLSLALLIITDILRGGKK